MKIRKVLPYGAAFLLGLFVLLTINIGKGFAVANNCAWSGAGDGTSFSDAANWSSCGGVAPQSGDNLVFDNTISNSALNNDLASASFGSITFQGAGPNSYDIGGNSFTLTGGLYENSTGGSSISQIGDIIENDITVSGNQNLQVGDVNSYIFFAGSLSGSGNLTVSGNGGVVLSDNTAYTGTITATAGTVIATDPNSLGTSSAPGAIINDGADFDISACSSMGLNGNLTLTGNSSIITGDFPNPKLGQAVGGCSGGGAGDEEYGQPSDDSVIVNLNGTITLGSDVTFAGVSGITNVNGPLQGSFKFTMLPGYDGKLVVSSSNNSSGMSNGTYTSPLFTKTLSDNQPGVTVDIFGNNVITIDGQRGDTHVFSGGSLLGSGTVGILTTDSGSNVSPGHSPGCLNTGNLILHGTFGAQIGGTTACSEYDQIKVTGTVDITGATLDASLYNGFKPAPGQSYTIIDNDGTDAVTGTFSGLAQGATINISGYVMKVSYTGGDGNDVVLSAISVPATPNTGFAMISSHPGVTLAATVLSTAGILIISRKAKSLAPASKR